MATGMRRSSKDNMGNFEDAARPTIKDGKKATLAGSKFPSREPVSKRARNQTKVYSKAEDGVQMSMSDKRFSSVSLPRRLLMAPILSLRRVRITKASTGQFVVFLLRVAALEAIRRVSTGRCPQVWWGLQGISLLQAPPFSWFLRWSPLRHFVEGTQSFSKPLMVLSLATAVSSAIDEIKQPSDATFSGKIACPLDVQQNSCRIPGGPDRHQTSAMDALKSALEQAEIDLPERFGDDELGNFLIASSGNVQKFVEKIQKSIKWRENYYFLNNEELKQWSHLVSWHDCDAKSRPTLVVRLGPAYSTLPADERPRFCQAVISQVEYGILNLLDEMDPRITVIMDCKGTTAIGFPVHMMKSCAVLVQENYPTRLAQLFAINLPPVVRFVANTVMQVIGNETRKKVNLLGDVYLTVLSEHVGGTDRVPSCLGGACHCPKCMEDRSINVLQVPHERSLLGIVQDGQLEEEIEDRTHQENLLTNYLPYNTTLRVAIVCFLMIWILLTMVGALHEPGLPVSREP